MVMPINTGYFIKEAATSFKRNWVMSIGGIVTIFLSLLLIGVSLLIGSAANSLITGTESKVTIEVYIKDDANQTDVEGLQRKLQTNSLVKQVNYISKDQAMQIFKEQMKKSPDVINNLEGNPLPASLKIELHDAHDVNKVVDSIKAAPEFKKVCDRPDSPDSSLHYGQDIVQRLFNFTRVIRVVGVVFIVMLAVVSLIFINNTIRMAIYARRNELSIMRLVGASNWFIRMPFIFEGMIQSIIGALLAIGVIMLIQFVALPKIQNTIKFMSFGISNSFIWLISLILIAGGIVIGGLGSWLAMRRYLKI
ncbi:MAG: permease-like cell division protein FtsX [Coriobacteriia bacterium]|nr:permease-like cell division protein FtsX [Coriobacteriia bacterium]